MRRNDEGGTGNPDIQWFRTFGGELRYSAEVIAYFQLEHSIFFLYFFISQYEFDSKPSFQHNILFFQY